MRHYSLLTNIEPTGLQSYIELFIAFYYHSSVQIGSVLFFWLQSREVSNPFVDLLNPAITVLVDF